MFRAKPVTIRNLLADKYHFRLPRFQRHYAWTRATAMKLFDDIQEARGLENPDGNPKATFLGAIVVIPHKRNTAKALMLKRRRPVSSDIIDGQQRLITLTLMLCVIRDMLTGRQRAAIEKAITGTSPPEWAYRLTLRRVDEDWFQKYAKVAGGTLIDPPPNETSDTLRNMLTNRNLFREELTAINDGDEDDVFEFAKYVLDHCQLALIEADYHDDAHQIYESLNHTGVALHRSSHIKTLAFRGTDEEDPAIDALAEEWDGWERQLGITRFDRLFAIIRSVHGSGNQPVVLENQKIIARVGGCETYLKTIVRPAVAGYQRFSDAINGVGDEPPEIRKYLAYLDWMKDTDWVGPVIKWFQFGPQDETATIEFLRRLDRLAFGLLIKGTNTKERAKRFKAVLDEIDPSGLSQDQSAIELTKKEQGRVLFRVSSDFQRTGGRACKLVLVRVSDKLGNTLTQHIPSDLSIEHIIPRTLRDDSPWHDVYESKKTLDRCFKRFANMALLPVRVNQLVKNMDFGNKKRGIFNPKGNGEILTPWAVTNYMAACKTWSASVIDQREDELMELIRVMWDLKGRGGRELDHNSR